MANHIRTKSRKAGQFVDLLNILIAYNVDFEKEWNCWKNAVSQLSLIERLWSLWVFESLVVIGEFLKSRD